MALEADVVFQQEAFSYPYSNYRDFCDSGIGFDEETDKPRIQSLTGNGVLEQSLHCSGNWGCPEATLTPEWDNMVNNSSSSSPEICSSVGGDGLFLQDARIGGRRKRRRARAVKNKEEVENQRMTHIAVERNRRKQMNEYLAMLRSMMPPSYAHRGDQASIVGGAINFVKELEQLLHSLKTHKHNYTSRYSVNPNNISSSSSSSNNNNVSALFSDFFTFPQYSITAHPGHYHNFIGQIDSMTPENSSAIADLEVTMVDSHANIKVLSRKQTKHLLKMVVGMQSLCLNILHLNVTTFDYMVLYSFSVKVEENCELTSVNEIAAAVYEMVGRIQEESFRELV